MTPRDPHQLAADVRAGIFASLPHRGLERDHDDHDFVLDTAVAALDALVARITDLEAREAERQTLRDAVAGRGSHAPLTDDELADRLYAAEAQVAALTQERDDYPPGTTRLEIALTEALNEADSNWEQQVAALKGELDAQKKGHATMFRAFERERARAEAAEAEVQRLREEREGYALLAEDEAVRGEYHAEGLDERGIYGGKSHEPIEERPVDRRHPDYADDPWLAEDTPKGGAA